MKRFLQSISAFHVKFSNELEWCAENRKREMILLLLFFFFIIALWWLDGPRARFCTENLQFFQAPVTQSSTLHKLYGQKLDVS
jgi:hypothetical protein